MLTGRMNSVGIGGLNFEPNLLMMGTWRRGVITCYGWSARVRTSETQRGCRKAPRMGVDEVL